MVGPLFLLRKSARCLRDAGNARSFRVAGRGNLKRLFECVKPACHAQAELRTGMSQLDHFDSGQTRPACHVIFMKRPWCKVLFCLCCCGAKAQEAGACGKSFHAERLFAFF
jgi:hypothetical protein